MPFEMLRFLRKRRCVRDAYTANFSLVYLRLANWRRFVL